MQARLSVLGNAGMTQHTPGSGGTETLLVLGRLRIHEKLLFLVEWLHLVTG